MPRKRRKPARREKAAPATPDVGEAIAAAALLLAIACVGLAVDSGADASFDAPKRLTALVTAAVATVAAFGFSRWKKPFSVTSLRGRSVRDWTALLFLTACAAAVLAALFSRRRATALDATRVLFLYALFVPLGASRVLERRKTLLLAVFLAVMAVDAVVSVLQARGLYQPFPLITQGSRDATGAFVGNPGYLALALALAAVACLALALLSARTSVRVAAGAGAAIFTGGLLVNRNVTSLTALLAGAVILLFARFGRRAGLPILGLLLLVGAGILAYRPMRERAVEAASAVRRRDWDRLVTFRLGPWAAAVQMTRERPWIGWGPGTFGAEFVPHRLSVEVEARRRMVNPLVTSSYSEAHCDYLQPFAEAGVPAGLAVLGAVVLLFRGLLEAARASPPAASRPEAVFLLAFLGAGAVAALTWFPLQRPISAVPLLLAAGRAWRISSEIRTQEPV